MRIGFVTRLLWERWGPFWSRLLHAAGAEIVAPDPARLEQASQDPRLGAVSGRAFRAAAAEAIALSGCERLIVPDPNFGYDGARGSAQDPFVADFPGALAQAVPGLPPLLAVPADLSSPGTESLAISILSTVSPAPGTVRRVWQTHRADLRTPRAPGLGAATTPTTSSTIALVGQPWHLDERLRDRLEGRGEHLVSAHQLDPAALRDEGWRVDDKLAPTDAEALGAVRRFARRPGIAGVRMVVDPESGADEWLARHARSLVRRPFEIVELPERAVPPVAVPVGAVAADGPSSDSPPSDGPPSDSVPSEAGRPPPDDEERTS